MKTSEIHGQTADEEYAFCGLGVQNMVYASRDASTVYCGVGVGFLVLLFLFVINVILFLENCSLIVLAITETT